MTFNYDRVDAHVQVHVHGHDCSHFVQVCRARGDDCAPGRGSRHESDYVHDCVSDYVRGRGRDHAGGHARGRARDYAHDRARDRARDRVHDYARDRARGCDRDHDYVHDRDYDRGSDHVPEFSNRFRRIPSLLRARQLLGHEDVSISAGRQYNEVSQDTFVSTYRVL